ncbi:hypothetical protein C1645_831967 [Glomus cerebriforme]|uniref:Uncharacterized protein n=1 Tax=Glomus cerebriforme TaxID=658196 RepID=A0A397SPR7_9GLOM|nr:hypothetical protein C1645_831967 [Glomus cerebriforme]
MDTNNDTRKHQTKLPEIQQQAKEVEPSKKIKVQSLKIGLYTNNQLPKDHQTEILSEFIQTTTWKLEL